MSISIAPSSSEPDAEVLGMVLGAFGRWADRAVDPAAIEAHGSLPGPVVSGAGALGLYGLAVPEAYGGAGFGLTATARVVEEVATRDRSLATSVGLHNGLGLHPLVNYGSDALKDAYLPRLAGGMVASFAATEPEAGSHIAGLRTTAEPDGRGGLVLNGDKVFVTNGGLAGVFTVLARTPGLGGARRGTSLLLLDREQPGLRVGAEERKLGIKASSTTTLVFEDAPVSVDRVLGVAGRGMEQMHHALTWGRSLMAAGALGTARAAYAMAQRHVAERRQFGRAIGSFGQVRQRMVSARVSLWTTEAVLRAVTRLGDEGVDIGWHSAIAKIVASEAAWSVVDDALQLHGGSGYIEDTGVARMLRDCRITRIYEGANDVLRMQVAGQAFASGSPEADLAEVTAPLGARGGARLRPMAEDYDRDAKRLRAAVEALRERFGLRVFEHQVLLAGLADALIARYTARAGFLRAAAAPEGSPERMLLECAWPDLRRRFDEGLQRSLDVDAEERIYAASEADPG
ncbi:MAG: acyl-CoA dehydrogenase family protein [Myxococcota bacterium]